jgi:hypothetical protein
VASSELTPAADQPSNVGLGEDSTTPLPRYLQRYLEIRYGTFLSVSEEVAGASFVHHALEGRQERGLHNLIKTVDSATYALESITRLLQYLDSFDKVELVPQLISELISRLDSMSEADVVELVQILRHLNDIEFSPSIRVRVDRAISRILPRLSGTDDSMRLAIECLVSRRVYRRRAAVKFYKRTGLDDAARLVLREQWSSQNLEAPELIALDRELISDLGLDEVLEISPSTFYRKCAIERAMLDLSRDEVVRICTEYPQELVWAVQDQERRDYVEILGGLMELYKNDLYLLNHIVRCLQVVGERDAALRAIAIAQDAITQHASFWQ